MHDVTGLRSLHLDETQGRVLGLALFVISLALGAPAFAQPPEADAETETDTDTDSDTDADSETDPVPDSADADPDQDPDPDSGTGTGTGTGTDVGSADDWQLPDDLDDPDADDGGFDFSAADEAIANEEDEGFWDRITYTVTSTTIAQYRLDNFNTFDHDDDYLTVWEKLEAAVQADDLRLSVRIDGVLALFEDECPEFIESADCIGNDLRAERFTAHWQHEGLKLDAVDSYAVLGRGLALSMRRVDILGIDTSLRGGQAAYDQGTFFVKLLGGAANPQNLDPQTLQIRRTPRDRLRRGVFSMPEQRDWVVGGEAGVRLGSRQQLEVGFHALRVWFADSDVDALANSVDVTVGGFHLNAPTLLDGKLVLYGEVNIAERLVDFASEFAEDQDRDGYAIYASAQLRLDNLAILFEWKDYRDYMVAPAPTTGEVHRIYSAAPTLELDQERPRALHNARGGRLQVDYGFRPGPWSASANALVYGLAEQQGDRLPDPFDGILVTHGYVRLQKINDALGEDEIGWTFDLVLGARRETLLYDDPAFMREQGDLDWRVIHGQVDAGIVFGRHSLELTVIHRSERRFSGFEFAEYIRGTSSLTYSWAGKVRVAPTLNWNTEQRGSTPSLYPGLEARVDFLEGSFVRVFGGRTPGGRICSGGVCRDVPPFEGVLGELVLRI